MKPIIVNIDWTRIHAAATAIDSIRGDVGRIGLIDVFGGTYSPGRSELITGPHSRAFLFLLS